MTRFEILALLHRAPFGLSVQELARNSCAPNWYTRAFRCATRTQANRLMKWGMVKKQRDRWRIFYGTYAITERGKERLAWAIKTGKLNPH